MIARSLRASPAHSVARWLSELNRDEPHCVYTPRAVFTYLSGRLEYTEMSIAHGGSRYEQ